MKTLLKFTKKFRHFMSIRSTDKLLLVEALCLTGIARILILTVPFHKLSSLLGKHMEESSIDLNETEYEVIKRVSWAVKVASKYTPWESKCLVQAATAQRMLKVRKISSTLYLGVKKDAQNKMEAHAWLRSGVIIITGGYEKRFFKEVSKFSNEEGGKKSGRYMWNN
jgi:hypothetical protein